MKSETILWSNFFVRREENKGHYEDTSRAKVTNAIIDLAEDINELNKKIKVLQDKLNSK
tara:strand:- start:26 stop:202 length:177 start_codon:yes stop_codon:yes gene_type:complete